MELLNNRADSAQKNNENLKPSNNYLTSRRELSTKGAALIQRYGEFAQFATAFNPSIQIQCARNPERSFMGEAPTLASLGQAYYEDQVNAWIMIQLEDLCLYAGVKEKMNMSQLETVAEIIRTEYYYLKASELLLFFFKFKAGEFGKFYGITDPLVITSALIEFNRYRQRVIGEYEREANRLKQEAQLEKQRREAVPCPEGMKFAKMAIERFNQE